MLKITINGEPFFVKVAGEGHPLLLVHGFPLSHAMWQPQIENLQRNFRVIVPDLRGCGKSIVTPGKVTMEEYADDLAMLLDALEIEERVTYCGLSMGGYIGWQFIRNHRDRLHSLILCDTRTAADDAIVLSNRHKMAANVLSEGMQQAIKTMLPKLFASQTRTDQPEIVETIRNVMLTSDPEGVAAALMGMAERPDMTDLLPEIDLPTLFVVGEEDLISTIEEMRSMASAVPNAELLEVAQAGHMAPLEQPAVVNAEIQAFLNRHV